MALANSGGANGSAASAVPAQRNLSAAGGNSSLTLLAVTLLSGG